MLLLLLRKKWSSSFAGSSMCSRSNQSELGKSPYNADQIRVALRVKWLVSNDKCEMNYWSTAIILVISMIWLFEMLKPSTTIDSIQAREGSLRIFWVSSSRTDLKLTKPHVHIRIYIAPMQSNTLKISKVVLKSSKEFCDPGKIGWDIHRSMWFYR